MSRVRALSFVLLIASALTAPAGAAMVPGGGGGPGLRRQVQMAVNDLVKAYAAANAAAGQSDEVRQAQQAATQARREYAAALAEAKAAVPVTPELKGLRAKVAALQATLDGERAVTDWSARLAVCTELSAARSRVNAIEAESLLADADLAIAKAAVSDAANAVKTALARQKASVQQDPNVLAARQRLDGLRRQLRGR